MDGGHIGSLLIAGRHIHDQCREAWHPNDFANSEENQEERIHVQWTRCNDDRQNGRSTDKCPQNNDLIGTPGSEEAIGNQWEEDGQNGIDGVDEWERHALAMDTNKHNGDANVNVAKDVPRTQE